MIKLVLSNIFRKKKDTILTGTILGIAVFTLVLIGCTYYQVHEGIKLTNDRLGADVIILPRTDKIDYSSALYTAEPSEEYIYLSNLEFLHGDYKIEDKTYQFFTHLLQRKMIQQKGKFIRYQLHILILHLFLMKWWIFTKKVDG